MRLSFYVLCNQYFFFFILSLASSKHFFLFFCWEYASLKMGVLHPRGGNDQTCPKKALPELYPLGEVIRQYGLQSHQWYDDTSFTWCSEPMASVTNWLNEGEQAETSPDKEVIPWVNKRKNRLGTRSPLSWMEFYLFWQARFAAWEWCLTKSSP